MDAPIFFLSPVYVFVVFFLFHAWVMTISCTLLLERPCTILCVYCNDLSNSLHRSSHVKNKVSHRTPERNKVHPYCSQVNCTSIKGLVSLLFWSIYFKVITKLQSSQEWTSPKTQTVQCSEGIFKVHDSRISKRLNKCGLFGQLL